MKKLILCFGTLLVLLGACTKPQLDLSKADLPDYNAKSDSIGKQDSVVFDGKPKCKITPSLSAGKYPIKSPENLVVSDITKGQSGVSLLVNLTILKSGIALTDCNVDLWHCNAKGEYSQYGEYSDQNYLRGRQKTDKDGNVSFKTIFPGCADGRAAHIYVHVTDNKGTSLKLTQIAFPQKNQNDIYSQADYSEFSPIENKEDKVFKTDIKCYFPDMFKKEGNGYKASKKILI